MKLWIIALAAATFANIALFAVTQHNLNAMRALAEEIQPHPCGDVIMPGETCFVHFNLNFKDRP